MVHSAYDICKSAEAARGRFQDRPSLQRGRLPPWQSIPILKMSLNEWVVRLIFWAFEDMVEQCGLGAVECVGGLAVGCGAGLAACRAGRLRPGFSSAAASGRLASFSIGVIMSLRVAVEPASVAPWRRAWSRREEAGAMEVDVRAEHVEGEVIDARGETPWDVGVAADACARSPPFLASASALSLLWRGRDLVSSMLSLLSSSAT